MSNPDRLTGLDVSFLAMEQGRAHMHVGSCLVFEGEPPAYEDVLEAIDARLHLVPRYRQKLAWVPFGVSRPRWVDDPRFLLEYHVRHTALPAPGGEDELKRLCGRLFAQELDREKPLWEVFLVEGLVPDEDGSPRFAMITKTHHALVDGISGVDIATVLFALEPDSPPPPPPAEPWMPRPEPTGAQLLAEALAERATEPLDAAQAATQLVRDPAGALDTARRTAGGVASMAWAGIGGAAPSTPLNRPIGPHRRFTWVEAELSTFRAIKSALHGTLNDAVLTAVAGATRTFLIERGTDVEGLTLKVMVPISTRADAERGALGNRVTNVYAPLPVGVADPSERFRVVHEAMGDLKGSGQAVGAEVLTRLVGFAPPTILAQAARIQGAQRLFNFTVTNVPGPQVPLYMGPHRLRSIFPKVPIVQNAGIGIAIMSYDGALDFGILADFDTVPDVERFADALRSSITELADLAGVPERERRRVRAPEPQVTAS